MVVPAKVFFTKGRGVHKDQLVSFEMALRNAGIAPFNLVYVSSIMPPDADIVSREEGLACLRPGEIVYCVMAKNASNEPDQTIAAAIGLAVPKIHDRQHGYLSEHHCFGVSEEACGEYAEELARTMLATILEKEGGDIVKTSNISIAAETDTNGSWTTVVATAVFVC
ncbi:MULTISPECIES: pyruvoyl-dependent arginine decarboxylase [Methanocorpusculum]|jgi:arginine decarboxylase|uniref:Pyruvoyl-dependent arginine decarboxylase n=1 Tax=Methanocorpusculum parvum TaxID=2193 RepID=A0AAX0Q666_9EURY|nr:MULTISPECIES: arginine decarboxylase, pyruvoyl-dependent [Methanocorpusculum]MDD2248390.1 arginine decarboxylase, pyruvoyl-dependent [Methanocorpusculum sp.]MDD2802978.1 arginine decarboxylase, pyruvoyl-dependent [Methanocorpusculum sp.]MDD3046899.1 arginine decarboxylase, pyruvoyl-dependent [Methanocorpusculum sp.]MDD3912241.1 arginine decarboxylase, pyruvoyl-dependent [Methanocorpusculum sp.]MDD4423008.1 arginine decarboxylase, pyruvoyl-dependent [Methanocorpusculum parvum]